MFKLKNRRIFVILTVLLVALGLTLAGCSSNEGNKGSAGNNEAKEAVIKVGATAKPHAEILEFIKPMLAKEGVKLEITTFTDYNVINLATDKGDVDANFFQHEPYLNESNAGNKINLVSIGKVHIEPMGLYSEKVNDVKAFINGDQIVVPSDPTNGGRALALLEKAGLIKLKEGVGILGTVQDIVDNPLDLNIKMVDAAQVPRTLSDPKVAGAVVNGNYALEIGLNPAQDSIFLEDKDSPYANIIAVKADKANDPNLQKLVKVLNSPEVKKFIEDTYKGAIVPAF